MANRLQDAVNVATSAQSLELATALQDLATGGKLSDFTKERRKDLITTVQQEHSDTAVKNFGEFTRAQDSVNNIYYYSIRNGDLSQLQDKILQRATSEAQGAKHDSELAKRQFEINEWSAANKAETLFMMQLFLIAVTFTIFLLFLNRMGVVPNFVFYLVSSLVFIAFILTFAIRYQYTAYSRDNRYWNRKRYASMKTINARDLCPGAIPDDSKGSLAQSVLTQGEGAVNALQAGLRGILDAGSAASAAYNTTTSGQ